MIKIKWESNKEENISEIQELKNKFILLLCIFAAKTKVKSRKKMEKLDYKFQKYLDYYKANKVFFSNPSEKEPYKTILSYAEEEKDVPEALQEQILEESRKYIEIPEQFYKQWFPMFFILTIFCGLITLLFSVKNSSLSMMKILFTAIFIILAMICFIVITVDNPKNVTAYLNYHFFNGECLDQLYTIRKEIIDYTRENDINNKKKTNERKVEKYSHMTKEELVKEFKKAYQELFQQYPHFLEILQKCKFNNRILMNQDYKIIKDKDRKMILCLIDKSSTKSNELELIENLFETGYSNLSDEMTSNHPDGKIKKLEDFLEKKEKLQFFCKKNTDFTDKSANSVIPL